MTPVSSHDALFAAIQTARLQVQTQRTPPTAATGAAAASTGAGQADANVFSNMLHSASAQMNKTETDAARAVTGLLSGEGVEVHEAMMATQRAELQFELALQVRNKAVAAYQQMMQMQF